MISMIDGGSRIPNVPDDAISPQDSFMSYFASRMAGSAIIPIITTDAPIIPVEAAMITPMIATAKAYPPGKPRKSAASERMSRSAMPERSSISPMKTNKGIATSSQLVRMPE